MLFFMDFELCDNEEEYLSSSDQYWGRYSSEKENYVFVIVLVNKGLRMVVTYGWSRGPSFFQSCSFSYTAQSTVAAT